MVTDTTAHHELVQNIERVEREKKIMREKIQEMEFELGKLRKESTKDREKATNLQRQVESLESEVERRQTRSAGVDLSTVGGMGELEASVKFKEQEVTGLKEELQVQKQNYKTKISELKEDLSITKERMIKLQKSEAMLEIYKQRAEQCEQVSNKNKELEEKLATM